MRRNGSTSGGAREFGSQHPGIPLQQGRFGLAGLAIQANASPIFYVFFSSFFSSKEGLLGGLGGGPVLGRGGGTEVREGRGVGGKEDG